MPLYRAELLAKKPLRYAALIHDVSQVLYLPFDYDDGSYARDRSGHNNHGTIYGATEVAGKIGTARDFDGTDDYVIASLPHSNSITIGLWAKYASLPSDNPGLFQAQPTSGRDDTAKHVGIWVEYTGYLWGRLIQSDGAVKDFPKNKYLKPDTWYYIVLTADAATGKGKQYVDGELVGEMSYDGTIRAFSYGKIGRQGRETWDGVIDEVRDYSRALSRDEIRMLMYRRLV